jgi:hypothetical protein
MANDGVNFTNFLASDRSQSPNSRQIPANATHFVVAGLALVAMLTTPLSSWICKLLQDFKYVSEIDFLILCRKDAQPLVTLGPHFIVFCF